MSEADDRARLRYLQLKAKAAAAEQAAPVEPAAPPAPEEPGKLESALRGAGQGFTLGQGANINGLIQALGEKYGPKSLPLIGDTGMGTAPNASLGDLFAANKGSFQRGNDAAFEAHPWLYGGANALASLSTLVPGGGARAAGETARAAGLGARGVAPLADIISAAARGTSVAPQAASLGRLALQGGRSGLLWGGAMGAGNSLEDLLRGSYGRFAGGIALNAIPGMVLGSAAGPISGLVARAAPALQSFAYRRAVKAAGPMLNDVRALMQGGRLESVGKKLMEMGLIRPGANVEEIANAVTNAAEQRGGDVHNILGELDALSPQATENALRGNLSRPALPAETSRGLTTLPPALQGRPVGDFPGRADLIEAVGTVNQRRPDLLPQTALSAPAAQELPGFNPYQVAQRARAELLRPLLDQPALQHLAPGLEEQILNLEAQGNRRLTFQRGNDIKRGYDKLLNWDREQTPQKELLKQLRGLVNQEVERSADAAATQAGDPNLINRFLSAKGDYRDLQQVSDFARDRVARMQAHNTLSLPDVIAGLGGLGGALGGALSHSPFHSLGSLAMGAATAYGSKLARERGNSLAANAALNLGQHLTIPNNLASLITQRAMSGPARAQGMRTLYDLLAGATPPAAFQGGDAALMGAP